MDKTKKIERLEKAEQRLMIYSSLVVLPLAFFAFIGPLMIALHNDSTEVPLSLNLLLLLPVAIGGAFFTTKSMKNAKKLARLRREWLEEKGLPSAVDFTYPLYSIAEGESRTLMHGDGDEVIVYRVLKRNGEFVVSSGVAELVEAKPKEVKRTFAEGTENDELWKLIDSNSEPEKD